MSRKSTARRHLRDSCHQCMKVPRCIHVACCAGMCGSYEVQNAFAICLTEKGQALRGKLRARHVELQTMTQPRLWSYSRTCHLLLCFSRGRAEMFGTAHYTCSSWWPASTNGTCCQNLGSIDDRHAVKRCALSARESGAEQSDAESLAHDMVKSTSERRGRGLLAQCHDKMCTNMFELLSTYLPEMYIQGNHYAGPDVVCT
jgi:hypothetical protein